jgi:HSP20 family protein
MEDFESPPTLGSRIAGVFEDFLGEPRRLGTRALNTFVPSLDLLEQDNEYVMKADLPGMREQDINVEVGDDNVLTISGERTQEENKNVRGYQYNERSYGSFSRSIELPQGVDASKVKADFSNGVLEVRFPKGESARARRIPLSSGQQRNLSAGGGNGHGAQTQQGQPQNQTQAQQSGRS